jgi:hypothetical protein
MLNCFDTVTPTRFERRLAPGKHHLVFKVVFGSYAAAARFFGVCKMTVWRWCHDRSPLPEEVLRALPDLLQANVAEAHQAQQDFRYFLAEPPSGRALHYSHPIQLKDGTMAFVQRRRAGVRPRRTGGFPMGS